jgi:hypothetical protein
VSESKTAKRTSPAAQIALAKKAAKLKADKGQKTGIPPAIITAKQRHLFRAALVAQAIADRKNAEANGHPPRAPPSVLLLSKTDVVGITGVTYVTIWKWMCAGTFPRSRVVGGKAMWAVTTSRRGSTRCRCRRSRATNRRKLQPPEKTAGAAE